MAWMSDEAYDFVTDSRDKKITARSARSKRTHCGKGGAVKFPSDYMSEKELKSMNGECIKYASLKKPMTFAEFKILPKDLMKEYINYIRKKFNAPDQHIANMLGVPAGRLGLYIRDCGASKGMGVGAKKWKRDEFYAWASGAEMEAPVAPVTSEEVAVEDTVSEVHNVIPTEDKDELIAVNNDPDIKVEETEGGSIFDADKLRRDVINTNEHTTCQCTACYVVPTSGEMNFKGNIDDILRTIRHLLDGKNVELEVEWKVLD